MPTEDILGAPQLEGVGHSRGCSSVGRALRSQRRGRRFDPDQLHFRPPTLFIGIRRIAKKTSPLKEWIPELAQGVSSIIPSSISEVKSCATERCLTPPGPEGSNGRQKVLCDAGKLDLCIYWTSFFHAMGLIIGLISSRMRLGPTRAVERSSSITTQFVRLLPARGSRLASGRFGTAHARVFSPRRSLAGAGSLPLRTGLTHRLKARHVRRTASMDCSPLRAKRTLHTYAQRDHHQFHC